MPNLQKDPNFTIKLPNLIEGSDRVRALRLEIRDFGEYSRGGLCFLSLGILRKREREREKEWSSVNLDAKEFWVFNKIANEIVTVNLGN